MKRSFLIFTALFFLSSCMNLIVAGNSITEKTIRSQRAVEQVRIDLKLKKEIKTSLKKDLKTFAHLNNFKNIGSYDIIVIEGRVYLLGVVAQKEISNFIFNKVWQNKQVKEVVNELQISLDLRQNVFDDAYLKTTVYFRLLFTPGVRTANHEIKVINNKAYIIGIAEDDIEIRKIGFKTSTTNGIQEAIVHIINKDDPRRITSE